MAPTSSKANYKSYEAQARMVRAIVAAHPEVKWNYKEIAACYGSDMTEHALNHRFRRVRAQSIIIREGRQKGFDMRDMIVDETSLPATQEAVEKTNIAKYFGQSTADGIQFQFRGIKKDADLLRHTEANGGNVATCLDLGAGSSSVLSTPCKPTPTRAPRGSRSTGKGTKRKQQQQQLQAQQQPPTTFIKRSSSDDEEDKEEEDDWSDKDDSPSKRTKTGALPGQRNGTPSRQAAIRAVATIADASAQLQDVEPVSDFDMPTPTPTRAALPPPTTIAPPPTIAPPTTIAPSSIFGPIATPAVPFSGLVEDPYFPDMDDGYGTGYFDDGFI